MAATVSYQPKIYCLGTVVEMLPNSRAARSNVRRTLFRQGDLSLCCEIRTDARRKSSHATRWGARSASQRAMLALPGVARLSRFPFVAKQHLACGPQRNAGLATHGKPHIYYN